MIDTHVQQINTVACAFVMRQNKPHWFLTHACLTFHVCVCQSFFKA